jgi:hypothetical protein
MYIRTRCALVAVLTQATTAAVAMADVPACPAQLGTYVATVNGSAVTVCPMATPRPGAQTPGCPYTTGMARVDVNTGTTKMFLGPCVADPAGGGSGDAGTPCFLDPCVPDGTYEYGYQIPAFAGCDESCAGPTSGDWATVVTVSSSACQDDGGLEGPAGLSFAIWKDVDAAVVDGAVPWSGVCTGPLPGPDGGYCAWEWLDGSAQWAPCPPDGGTLCPGYTGNGPAVPVECPTGVDAGGGFAANGLGVAPNNEAVSDSGATAPPAEMPATAGSARGGGCSMAPGQGGAAYATLAGLSLAIGLRSRRPRRAGAPEPASGRGRR